MANTSLNSSINLVDLDFNSLKYSFINYLKSQDQFKDYEFEGSNINLLLDLLAYNTFKNTFYLNMVLSEGFLDSAQLRNSLLSHAKELNYLPRSKRSAKAKVKISFTASGESQPYIVPKGSQLSTLIKSASYVFSIPETITVASANSSYTFTTDIYEGIFLKDSYVYLDGIENQRFKITNKNVDTRSIAVVVYEDGSEIGETYTLKTTLLDLNEYSKVFFLQTSETGHYEIYFGDNILGKRPKINSTILIDYRVSTGERGNGAKSFSVDFDPTGTNELLTTPTLEVLEGASNGQEEETDESIRYYAPRHFQVQERAVTTSDYEILLKTEFPEINAVNVFGGEEADPPQFGRVFISVDISNVDGLPDSKKTEYKAFLKRRSPLSIEPVFIEQEYTYLSINSKVRYNLNVTTNSIARIKTLVSNTIKEYNETELDDFNVTLRKSQLSALIDASDISIISNDTDIDMYKKINPALGVASNIVVDFGLELDQFDTNLYSDYNTIYSSAFRYNGEYCVLNDDGEGNLFFRSPNSKTNLIRIGQVNYSTGKLLLTNFLIDSYEGSALKIYAIPKDKDVQANRNNILTIEPDEIKIEVEALRI